VTNLPRLFESVVLESVQLVKEAVLAIDNREDDILEHPVARANTELLIQKVSDNFSRVSHPFVGTGIGKV
jgi:hypothetical protein